MITNLTKILNFDNLFLVISVLVIGVIVICLYGLTCQLVKH